LVETEHFSTIDSYELETMVEEDKVEVLT
jgi:hypothetical protein